MSLEILAADERCRLGLAAIPSGPTVAPPAVPKTANFAGIEAAIAASRSPLVQRCRELAAEDRARLERSGGDVA